MHTNGAAVSAGETMNLPDLVELMRAYAIRQPFDTETQVLVNQGCCREVRIENELLSITLSLDIVASVKKKVWHLSISKDNGAGAVDKRIVRIITEAFLGETGVLRIEPEYFPPMMRNIVQFIKEA